MPEPERHVRAYGDRAVLLDSDDPMGLAADLVGWPGVVDVVPGAASVLVVAASPGVARALSAGLSRGADLARTTARTRSSHDRGPRAGAERATDGDAMIEGYRRSPVVELPVVYDGPDLDEVGRLTGLGAAEVRRRHAAGAYVVAVVGFAPGFGYLSGLDPALAVPRRDDPRPAVPSGSVAVGGPWTGVYPRATPGGWRLIGRTGVALWSLDRDPPALLTPGVRVRFVDAGP